MLPTALSNVLSWTTSKGPAGTANQTPLLRTLQAVNGELWLIVSLFALAGVINFLVASQRVVLGLYTLPTVVSAYLYGRRHATLTAFASVLMIILLTWFNADVMTSPSQRGAGRRGVG